MPARVPVELIDAANLLGECNVRPRGIPATTVRESPTAFCENTPDVGIAAILAHVRHEHHRHISGRLAGPWHLEICPTSACPIKCAFCSYTGRNKGGASLPWSVLQDLLDDAEELGVVGIYYSGGGDPLAYKDIDRAIERAAEFSGVAIQSNCLLLHRLLSKGIDWFNWAIDILSWGICAHDEQTFCATCVSSAENFTRILENLKSAIHFRNEWSRRSRTASTLPPVHINGKILLYRDNYNGVRRLVTFARAFGLDSYHIRLVDNFEPGQDVSLSESAVAELREALKHDADPLLQSLYRCLSYRQGESTPCPPHTIREGQVAIVETNGDVYLSVPSDGNLRFSIGNVNRARLRELWGSAGHLEAIRRLETEFHAPLSKDRHHKNDLVIEDLLTGKRTFDLTPGLLTGRNFRIQHLSQL